MTELFKDNGQEWTDAGRKLDRKASAALNEILEELIKESPDVNFREVAYILNSAVEVSILREIAKRKKNKARKKHEENQTDR